MRTGWTFKWALVTATGWALLNACAPEAPARHVPVTTSSKPALKAFLKGRELVENLRRAEGREFFTRAVALDPGFAMAHLYLAQTAPSTGDIFPALRRAVELVKGASPGEAHVILAFEAGVNSQPVVQREHLEALLKAFPGDERVHNLMGSYFFGRQEWPEAIAAYNEAIRINPAFPPVYNQLGYALRNLGRLDEASDAFLTYMKLVPDEPNPYDSHAELLLRMGKYREAVAGYQKALAIDPNFAASYVGMGNAYLMQGDFAAASNAFTALRYIARDDGQRRQATIWLASTSLHEGRPDSAVRLIQGEIEASRERGDQVAVAESLNLLANVLLDTGAPDPALAKLEESLQISEAAELTPEVKEATRRNGLAQRARIALARNDRETASTLAADYCRQAEVKQLPFEVRRCHELRGLLALDAGDPTTAVTQLLEANPQDPRVLFALALAYQAAGKSAELHDVLSRIANFNALSFPLSLVRPRALAMLAKEERITGPSHRDAAPARADQPSRIAQ